MIERVQSIFFSTEWREGKNAKLMNWKWWIIKKLGVLAAAADPPISLWVVSFNFQQTWYDFQGSKKRVSLYGNSLSSTLLQHDKSWMALCISMYWNSTTCYYPSSDGTKQTFSIWIFRLSSKQSVTMNFSVLRNLMGIIHSVWQNTQKVASKASYIYFQFRFEFSRQNCIVNFARIAYLQNSIFGSLLIEVFFSFTPLCFPLTAAKSQLNFKPKIIDDTSGHTWGNQVQ